MNLFVSGFGPFMRVEDNPSEWLAEKSGCDHAVLEVSFAAVDTFLDEYDWTGYDGLILIGVASHRFELTPEVYAWNSVGPHADVTGIKRTGILDPDGPLRLDSTLWDASELSDWTRDGIARPSFHPGGYLCNYILYRALAKWPDRAIGFLHVPDDERMGRDEKLSKLLVIIETLRVRVQ